MPLWVLWFFCIELVHATPLRRPGLAHAPAVLPGPAGRRHPVALGAAARGQGLPAHGRGARPPPRRPPDHQHGAIARRADARLGGRRAGGVDDLARVAEQETWSDADRRFLLNLCFSVNWDKIIRRHPRYAELLDRRPAALADPTAFSDADYRDLVTWFNLAWIDPGWRDRDPVLSGLVAKGRGFTLEDVRAVHARQRQIASASAPPLPQAAGGRAARGHLQPVLSPDPAAAPRHGQREPAQPGPALARAALPGARRRGAPAGAGRRSAHPALRRSRPGAYGPRRGRCRPRCCH